MTKNLVLVGGGHSHAIALRMFALNLLPNLRLILVSEMIDTPYSGMLPGHIAGFYPHQQCHINLQHLAKIAQADFYIDRVINFDLQNNQVICENHPSIDFDILSIDIGSTPQMIDVPGATEYAIPAKPWSKLLQEWNKLCLDYHNNQPLRIAVVGGGAGGVELALAIQARLESKGLEMHLFHQDMELMPSHHASVRKLMKRVLLQRGIHLHLGEKVCKVEKAEIACESGLKVEYHRAFWVTQASAPQWMKTTGLTTDEKGFILVDDTLQSISHPHIYATGDIATMVNHPRPKAGVFAVRQGKPLFNNLRRFVLGEPLQPYTPQKQYLSLIGMGNGSAIANRGNLTLPPSRLLWFWKDWIDRRFMKQFES
jgi:pyridine nucleotide-disulfide oxidoreductase family protein